MTRSRLISPALILLVLGLLLAGCISIGPPPPPGDGRKSVPTPTGTPAGDSLPVPPGSIPKVSLSAALAALAGAEREGTLDTRGLALRQVYGYGVDSSGLARSWVLGMEKDGKTTLLAYSGGEWRVLGMEVALPEGEVKPGELIPPEQLFRENLDTIVTEMNRMRVGEADLALNATTYLVTVRSAAGSSTLTFSAKGGTLAGRQPPAPPTSMAGVPPSSAPGRIGLPVLVPLGASALAFLASRRRR